MRVIAGSLGGRSFDSPRGHKTHPMSDKIRGALFNMLGDIEGLTALDAFAGSGAVGFEAISRGALHVTAIDVDKEAHRTIQSNSQKLNVISRIKAIRANVAGWSDNNQKIQFDIIVADPPYDRVQEATLIKLVSHLKAKGTYVLSWPGGQTPPVLPSIRVVAHKTYGDAQLVFYQA